MRIKKARCLATLNESGLKQFFPGHCTNAAIISEESAGIAPSTLSPNAPYLYLYFS
jgi:hypothetical protein